MLRIKGKKDEKPADPKAKDGKDGKAGPPVKDEGKSDKKPAGPPKNDSGAGKPFNPPIDIAPGGAPIEAGAEPPVPNDLPTLGGPLASEGPAVPDLPSLPNAGGKVEQAIVVYMGPENGPFQCANCSFFQAPNACQVVSGDIYPDGICHLFTPPAAPMEAPGMEGALGGPEPGPEPGIEGPPGSPEQGPPLT